MKMTSEGAHEANGGLICDGDTRMNQSPE